MKITEVTQPSEQAINEAVERGELTLTEAKIIKTHIANQWSEPMTAEEMNAFEAKMLAEAGIK
jgi:polyhydroxyalkanoate synthesis regulator phasin